MTLGEIIVVLLKVGFILLLVPLAVIALRLIWKLSTILIIVGLVILAIDIAVHGTVEQMSDGAGTLAILLCLGIAAKAFIFFMREWNNFSLRNRPSVIFLILGGIFYGNGNLCYAGCNGICFSDIRIVFLDVGIHRSTACWQSIGREIL